jgi:putative transposase
MIKNHHLAKHIQDHAWGKLIQFAQSKVAKAGKMVPKTLADEIHLCPNCGQEMDRDINAGLNIRTLGLRGRAYQDPTPTLCKEGKYFLD